MFFPKKFLFCDNLMTLKILVLAYKKMCIGCSFIWIERGKMRVAGKLWKSVENSKERVVPLITILLSFGFLYYSIFFAIVKTSTFFPVYIINVFVLLYGGVENDIKFSLRRRNKI